MDGFRPPTDVPVFIMSFNEMCIHADGGEAADKNGCPCTLCEKRDQPNVWWTVREDAQYPGWYRIETGMASHRCLHNHGRTADNGASCTLWDGDHAGENLRVRFEEVPGVRGYVYIIFKDSGKCVHCHGGCGGSGTRITQWQKVQQNNLYWNIVPKNGAPSPADLNEDCPTPT